PAVACQVLLVPARHALVGVEARHDRVVGGQEVGIAGRGFEPLLTDLAQHDDGVVIGRDPDGPVQVAEQLPGVRLPGPVEVAGEFGEALDPLGQPWHHVQVTEDVHAWEPSFARPRTRATMTIAGVRDVAARLQRGAVLAAALYRASVRLAGWRPHRAPLSPGGGGPRWRGSSPPRGCCSRLPPPSS